MTDSDSAACPCCGFPGHYGRCSVPGCPCNGLRCASEEAQMTAEQDRRRRSRDQARTVRLPPPQHPWWLSRPSYGGRAEARSVWEAAPETPPLTGAQAMIRLRRQLDEMQFEHEGGD